MLFELKNFLYKSIKHIVEEYGTHRYRLRHYMDVLLYLYWLLRTLFISLMYFDSKKFPFYQYDYASLYYWQYRKILNKFFIIIVISFMMICLLCIRTLFFTSSNTLSFQILYDCIVYNTDQYFKSLDTIENVVIKKSKRFHQYQQKFPVNHPILSGIFPNFIQETLFSIRVWIDSWLQLDHVDRKLFEQQNRMRLFPHASFKCRTNIL